MSAIRILRKLLTRSGSRGVCKVAMNGPLASQYQCGFPVEPWLVRHLLQEQRQALRRRS